MADTFSKLKRSEIMRAVKPHGNKSTELQLISIFRRYGIIGWRRGYPLYGNPDFVFPRKRVVVFVDGCFWHGHDCRNTRPRNNKKYWHAKIIGNMIRDKKVARYLRRKGWHVYRIWECGLHREKIPVRLLDLLMRA